MKDYGKILSFGGFMKLNIRLVRSEGIVNAALFSELCCESEYWRWKGKLKKDGWFFSTTDNLERRTGLKRCAQDTAIKRLKEIGLIDVLCFGLPKTRHFKINWEHTEKFLSDKKDAYDDRAERLFAMSEGQCFYDFKSLAETEMLF